MATDGDVPAPLENAASPAIDNAVAEPPPHEEVNVYLESDEIIQEAGLASRTSASDAPGAAGEGGLIGTSVQEVSGSGNTLWFHIEEEQDIEAPDPLQFNEWQRWRASAGRRPKRAVDGVSTTSGFEAKL